MYILSWRLLLWHKRIGGYETPFSIFDFFYTNLNAQVYKTLDSLKTEYRTLKDSEKKVEVLQKMGQYYYDRQKIDSAIYLTKESAVFANKIKDATREFESSITLGHWFLIKSDFPKSKYYPTKALEISNVQKDKKLEMRALKMLGLFLS